MIAVMWTALFGLAVVAVDFGYLYTKKRSLQSVADSALKAAMPVYRTQGVHAAQTRALQIAQLSGYEPGVRDTTVEFAEPAVGTQFKVTIGRTHPTFFGGIFGMVPRSIKASATGMVTTGAGSVAIHANDNRVCAGQWDWGCRHRGHGRRALHRQRRRREHEQDPHRKSERYVQRIELQDHRHGDDPLYVLE